MNRKTALLAGMIPAISLILAGCAQKMTAKNPKLEDPPAADVEQEQDGFVIKVAHPELFPLAVVSTHTNTPELNVTGVVSVDVARSIPVVSMASGRVIE